MNSATIRKAALAVALIGVGYSLVCVYGSSGAGALLNAGLAVFWACIASCLAFTKKPQKENQA